MRIENHILCMIKILSKMRFFYSSNWVTDEQTALSKVGIHLNREGKTDLVNVCMSRLIPFLTLFDIPPSKRKFR